MDILGNVGIQDFKVAEANIKPQGPSQSNAKDSNFESVLSSSSNKKDNQISSRKNQLSSKADEKGTQPREYSVGRRPSQAASRRQSRPIERIDKQVNNDRVQPVKKEYSNESDPIVESQNSEEIGYSQNSTELLTRRAAMQNFLQKMKSEVGVDPEQIIQAFSELNIEQLTRPPDDNVHAILERLDLSEEQYQKANVLFQNMLQQTASNSVAEYLKDSGQQLSLEVMSQKDIRTRQANRGIDEMNSKFFLAGQHAQPKSPGPLQNMAVVQQSPMQVRNSNPQALESGPDFFNHQDLGSQHGSTLGSNAQQQSGFAGDQNQSQQFNQYTNQNGFEIKSPQVAAENYQKVQMNQLEQMSAPTPVEMSEFNEAMPELMTMQQKSTMDMAGDSDSNTQEVEGEFVDAKGFSSQVQGQKVNSEGQKINPFTVQSLPTDADEAANAKEVINQTQFLIKKGGGEMRMQLQPEGIGQVNLKVAVLDGNVNVEMITETNEARKLIERGLGDLKATLASHKLNVDMVKVDSAGNISENLDNMQEESNKNFARQFMDDFRQQNQDMRRGMYGIAGARLANSQTEDEASNSIEQQGSSRGSQRRLNLVA